MTLWLVRHDRLQGVSGICYGSTDLPPAVPPEETARRLRPELPADTPVFSSPLQRCAALARALHPEPVFLEGLREVDYGDWEMRPWTEIRGVDDWAARPFNFRFPGGESVPAFLSRVADTLTRIPAPAVVITHGGVIRAALHHLEARPLEEAFRAPVPPGSVTPVIQSSSRR